MVNKGINNIMIILNYTDAEIQLLKNGTLSAPKVASQLNIHPHTVLRYRKKHNIKSCGQGGPRLGRYKREIRTCKQPECANTFEVVVSHKKRYCSRSCHITANNPAHNGNPRSIRNPNRDKYKIYSGLVHNLSQVTYIENIHVINPERKIRTLAGKEDGWQLDHIITIKEGYEKGIPPEELAKVDNLRMLPWKENLKRNRK